MAEQATCSQSRLIHLDLAGRYSIKAADAALATENSEDEKDPRS
jgi:hypothetical protein